MCVWVMAVPCELCVAKNGGPDDVTENPPFSLSSRAFLLDDLSIHILGNSIFTRCAPTARCCFSLECHRSFFLFFFLSWKIIPYFTPWLWRQSCYMLCNVYRGIVLQHEILPEFARLRSAFCEGGVYLQPGVQIQMIRQRYSFVF